MIRFEVRLLTLTLYTDEENEVDLYLLFTVDTDETLRGLSFSSDAEGNQKILEIEKDDEYSYDVEVNTIGLTI